jgi:uncharacterized protein (DUF302 family)
MTDTDSDRRRRVLQGVGALLGGSAVVGAGSVVADEHDDDADDVGDGLVTVEGGDGVEETVDAIRATIEDEEDLMLVGEIDHAENAEGVGLDLPPTTLLLFGNPAAGTPLMQENQRVGIDLPQKLLVWCDEDGETNVTYNDPEYLAERHGLEENDEVLANIGEALETIARSGSAED